MIRVGKTNPLISPDTVSLLHTRLEFRSIIIRRKDRTEHGRKCTIIALHQRQFELQKRHYLDAFLTNFARIKLKKGQNIHKQKSNIVISLDSQIGNVSEECFFFPFFKSREKDDS
jgi:hypothetical protein